MTPSERRRRWVVVATSALILAVGAAGAVVGSQLRSPAEKALETAPPELGLVTTPVKVGRLGGEVLTRGSLVEVSSSSVDLPGVAAQGKLVTAVASVGDEVTAGDSPLELDGRPLLVLPGSIVIYRDLVGGTVGQDVEAIQQALVNVGLDPGEIDGRYGPSTAASVEVLYRQAGYLLPTPPTSEEELVAAETAVEDAKDALRLARVQRADTQASREATVNAAQRALDDAIAAVDEIHELASKMVARAVLEMETAQLAVKGAEGRLEEATTEEERLVAEQAVEQAVLHFAAAEESEAAVRGEAESMMRGAESAVQDAKAALADATRAINYQDVDAQVASAERVLELAMSRLESTRLGWLTPLPAGEVVLLPTFPLVVADVKAGKGSVVEASALTLAPSVSMVAVAAVPVDVARRLEVGAFARIIPDANSPADGVVTWVASSTGVEAVQYRFRDSVTIPDGQVGVEVTPARDLDVEPGTPVATAFELFVTSTPTTIVPVSAIRTDADGSTWVAVLDNGRVRRVNVAVGPTADGAASVVSSDLADGDEVVLGEF